METSKMDKLRNLGKRKKGPQKREPVGLERLSLESKTEDESKTAKRKGLSEDEFQEVLDEMLYGDICTRAQKIRRTLHLFGKEIGDAFEEIEDSLDASSNWTISSYRQL